MMYEDPDRISRLIADSLRGSLSEEEAEELRHWAERSPQNWQLLELLGDAESVRKTTASVCGHDAEVGWQRIEQRVRRRRMWRLTVPLAGFAAAVAVVGGVFLISPQSPQRTGEPVVAQQTVAVKLFRSTGEVIAVDSTRRIDLAEAVAQSNGHELTLEARSGEGERKSVFNEVAVPAGKQFSVMLSDGTRVVLNASSSLRFPDRFAANGPREVSLSGEAFFEVHKDSGHPFIVHAGDGYVRVTGTEFNLSCYDDAPALVATLVGGSVSVGGRLVADEVVLEPGMQATQDKASGAVTTRAVDVGEFTDWTKGLFSFRERPLSEIMASVARWYGCRVSFENPASAAMRFTGQVSRSSTLAELAAYFSHTGEVTVEVHDDLLVIRSLKLIQNR